MVFCTVSFHCASVIFVVLQYQPGSHTGTHQCSSVTLGYSHTYYSLPVAHLAGLESENGMGCWFFPSSLSVPYRASYLLLFSLKKRKKKKKRMRMILEWECIQPMEKLTLWKNSKSGNCVNGVLINQREMGFTPLYFWRIVCTVPTQGWWMWSVMFQNYSDVRAIYLLDHMQRQYCKNATRTTVYYQNQPVHILEWTCTYVPARIYRIAALDFGSVEVWYRWLKSTKQSFFLFFSTFSTRSEISLR